MEGISTYSQHLAQFLGCLKGIIRFNRHSHSMQFQLLVLLVCLVNGQVKDFLNIRISILINEACERDTK